MAAGVTGGRAMVSVFDGRRTLYADSSELLIIVRDGNQKVQSRDFHSRPEVFFTGLPLFNNFGDNYTFLASADGYKDAGFFPVKLAANVDQIVDLLLVSQSNGFNFAKATWNALGNSRRGLKLLLANGASGEEAANRYSGTRKEVDGVNCVMVEPDIDYFKDAAAHLLMEVAVNTLGGITDPRAVYALRWIAGRRAGVLEFDPLYTIEKM